MLTDLPRIDVASTPDALLADLHTAQYEAVTYPGGPLLIIAGAGTGKTTVITRRIAHLIATKQAHPHEILALTFSEKASREMEERVDQLVPYGYVDTWISTFHAFGDRVLREQSILTALAPTFQVLTKRQMIIFLREHIFTLPLCQLRPTGNPTHYVEALANLCARAKDEDITPAAYLTYARQFVAETTASDDAAAHERAAQQMELAQLYAAIQTLMRQYNRADFGDQIALTLELFRAHPSVLEQYRTQFKYILVDEFQDTNFAQFELVKLLAPGCAHVTIVADDDQSIYKFRGAALSNIMNFLQAYPQARQVILSRNYRSTQPILDAAYRLIRFNDPERLEVQRGVDKRLRAARSMAHAVTPQWRMFDAVEEEANWVAETIVHVVTQQRLPYRDCAILVRSNKDAEPFVRALSARGLPWQFPGMMGQRLRQDMRLLLALLRMVADPEDSLSWYYVAASPLYAIPAQDLTLCTRTVRRQHHSLRTVFLAPDQFHLPLSIESRERIRRLLEDAQRFVVLAQELPPGQLLYRILTEAGGQNYLKTLAEPEQGESLRHVAAFFEQLHQLESQMTYARLPELLAHAELWQSLQDDPQQSEQLWDEDAVQVMTVHKAKGLEFPVVFLVSLVQGRFPVPGRRDPLELPESLIQDLLPRGDVHLQEERRLFYVGMTRAKDYLFLSAAARYGGKSARKRSQFVLEALNLPAPDAIQARPLDIIERDQPMATPVPASPERAGARAFRMDPHGLDDYLTCPLKYKFSHVLRVPILRHHAVVFGGALHSAIEQLLRAKQANRSMTVEELWAHFTAAWHSEGFLTRQHEELRYAQGRQILQQFWERETASARVPTHVEEPFDCVVQPEGLRIAGRWDRIDLIDGQAVIIDYKSSDVREVAEAHQRVRRSVQMAVYALAWQIRHKTIPQLELHFLGSQVTGTHQPTPQHLDMTRRTLVAAAQRIQARDFVATPAAHTCQWCAYQQICPEAHHGTA